MVICTDTLPDKRQLIIIADQLGREPRGIQTLAATDSEGTPLVLRMESVVEGKPFPTLFWLCSEWLKVVLSRLEAQGIIKHLEARLKQESDFLAAYHASHEDYVAKRWHYMTPMQRSEIERLGYADILRKRGIGGIANWDQVRCLHTQYAHHLCGHNVIGQWLDKEYGVIDGLL